MDISLCRNRGIGSLAHCPAVFAAQALRARDEGV